MVKTSPWRVNLTKRMVFDMARNVIDQPTPGPGKPRRGRVIRGKRSAWAEIRKMAGLR